MWLEPVRLSYFYPVINFIIILICITAGLLLQNKLPKDAHKAINAWLIWIGLPAISFKYLPSLEFSSALLMPVMAPIVVWCVGWTFSYLYSRYRKLDAHTSGCMKLSTGLSNTSFLGFPLVAAYFGEEYIGIAVICDQVTFLLLATAAIIVAVNASGTGKLSIRKLITKMLTFPALPACVLALILPSYIDISALDPMFDKLASTVPPLALFSIGLQLQFKGWRVQVKHITAALICKLLITPALVLLLAVFTKSKGIETQVAIFESAMPTLVSSGIVAAEYHLNPKLSSLIIGIGIALAFATTACWFFIIQAVI